MDYRRDYILRMIEMIGEFIALVLGLIKKGNIEEATKSMDNAYYTFLKQDAKVFREMPLDKITDELLHKHNFTNNHLQVLAELFYADGELHYTREDHPMSLELFKKSLVLFEFVERQKRAFSLDMQTKLGEIRNKIEELSKKS